MAMAGCGWIVAMQPRLCRSVFMTSRGIQNIAYVILLALIVYAWALGG